MSPSDDETPRLPEIPAIEAELRRLGDALDVPSPPPADVAAAVRARIEREAATPARRRPLITKPRLAAGLAILIAVLIGATPQGRAAVTSILRFAGVEINVSSSPSPTPSSVIRSLPGEGPVTLDQARQVLPIVVPATLGPPTQVRMADGGRVVSLFWPGLRLDEYDGRLDIVFRKDLGPPWPEQVSVPMGWWLDRPHSITYIPSGGRREIPLGVAGPTLIWQQGRLGLRLEGAKDLTEALGIARSVK
ncbi:hypothetical protein J5X84_14100 [Streptosporangiaceae bacterium NEAU-GS5]|nr:hypothetical protein [Streptosporangiaceae bacterium NEAU-GS5]